MQARGFFSVAPLPVEQQSGKKKHYPIWNQTGQFLGKKGRVYSGAAFLFPLGSNFPT